MVQTSTMCLEGFLWWRNLNLWNSLLAVSCSSSWLWCGSRAATDLLAVSLQFVWVEYDQSQRLSNLRAVQTTRFSRHWTKFCLRKRKGTEQTPSENPLHEQTNLVINEIQFLCFYSFLRGSCGYLFLHSVLFAPLRDSFKARGYLKLVDFGKQNFWYAFSWWLVDQMHRILRKFFWECQVVRISRVPGWLKIAVKDGIWIARAKIVASYLINLVISFPFQTFILSLHKFPSLNHTHTHTYTRTHTQTLSLFDSLTLYQMGETTGSEDYWWRSRNKVGRVLWWCPQPRKLLLYKRKGLKRVLLKYMKKGRK
jgi:hypothetical protein